MNKRNLEQKVLVVDDERDIRRMVIRVVRSIYPKARIRQASNGRQAKEKIMGWYPDLVILDLHMPYMNGLELSENIRENWCRIRTSVLVITGYPEPGIHEVVFDRGVSEFLLKPFDRNDLASSVRRLLA